MILDNQKIKKLYEKLEKETKGDGAFKIAELLYSVDIRNRESLFFNIIRMFNCMQKEKLMIEEAIKNNDWSNISEIKIDDLFYEYCISLDKKTFKIFVNYLKELNFNLIEKMQYYNIKLYKENIKDLTLVERNDLFLINSKEFIKLFLKNQNANNDNRKLFIKSMNIISKNKINNNINLIVEYLEQAFLLNIDKNIIKTWIKSFINNHKVENLGTIQKYLLKEDLIEFLGNKGYAEWFKNNKFNGVVKEETLNLHIKIDLDKIKKDKSNNKELIEGNFKKLIFVIDSIYKEDLNYCGCYERNNADKLELFVLYRNNNTLIKDVVFSFLEQVLSYQENRKLNEMTEDFIKTKNKIALELNLKNNKNEVINKVKL